jgi:hypothetical protein
LLALASIYKIAVLDHKYKTTGFGKALSNLNALTIPNITIGTNNMIVSHAIIDKNINQLFLRSCFNSSQKLKK